MQPTDFKAHPSGRVVRTDRDYWAYLPAPLEPALIPSLALMRALSEADRALSELAGIARTLPNPHLLIGPFLRREAVLSSRIEGTRASLSDLFFFEASEPIAPEVGDVREVANYVAALEYGLARLDALPLSLRLTREIHERLLAGVRGQAQTPGEFRRSQNWIGPPGCTLAEAAFVPPPVPEMHEALHALETYLHGSSALPPLLRLAAIHYQFEAIHPFLDGNGRMGRLLITLLLCKDGLLSQPLLYLSAFFERHRDEYYRGLQAVSREGDWEGWFDFFLRAVASQSRDAIDRSARLLALWQAYRVRLQAARASALLLRLVDALFNYPALSNRRASQLLGVTPRAAQLSIQKLIDAGILTEATGRQRNRIYVGQEILRTIEDDAPAAAGS